MTGNTQLVAVLNRLLADELAARNQYLAHYSLADQWGYSKLRDALKERASDEAKHADALASRIIFLGGYPATDQTGQVLNGRDVPAILANDLAAESRAVLNYNAAISLSVEVADNATRDVLAAILSDEDDHVNEIETAQDQIAQMGLPFFLNAQV